MEAFYDLVRRIVKSFGAVWLDYMFNGALAASYYGVPRTTMDVDVVVKLSQKEARSKLVSALKRAGLQVDEERIDAALKSGYRIVTFGDTETPYNIDIIISDRKLEKRAGTVADLPTFYQTPEDLILAKLRMIKAPVPRERALKDEEDVKAILRFTRVDVDAVKKLAERENTLSILEEIVADASS